MVRRIVIPVLAGVLALAAIMLGLPAWAGLSAMAESVRSRLDPVLLTYDLLAEPGKDVSLDAALRSGLRLQGVEGKRIQFCLGDRMLGEAVGDKEGHAAIAWQVPPAPADYRLTVKVHPADQPERKVRDAPLLVCARKADAKLAVVDLDKTLVASGFERVLVGGAKPMDGCSVVMGRLATDHTIVYLTHRPDLLAPESKAWLSDNAFPPGPVLTSTLATMAAGSGVYKSARLELIRKTYPNVQIGIGDKISDAQVYARNGVKAILILQVKWSEDEPKYFDKLADQVAALPDSVEVVTNWAQVSEVLFDKAAGARDAMVKRLRQVADELRKRESE